MTDRLKGVYVSFDSDIRDDDAQGIIDAIKMIKGVLHVETSVVDGDDWMNRSRISYEYKIKILEALKELK